MDYRAHLRAVVASSATSYGYTRTVWTAGAAARHASGSVGFLPSSGKRFRGTIDAISGELCHDGFVSRCTMTRHSQQVDGLPPGDTTFLPCTLWLADSYLLTGRKDDGRDVFERALGPSNDLGLLSQEYDTDQKRLVGNFPQALTHLGVIKTALDLHTAKGPSRRRASTGRA